MYIVIKTKLEYMETKKFTSEELEQMFQSYQQAVYSYYNTDETEMSDLEFDYLKETLESNGYDLSGEEAVETDTETTSRKRTDKNNMLSLYKVQVFSESFEEKHLQGVIDWLRQSGRNINKDTKINIGWKLDGLAIKILFNKETHEIEDIITRGNFSVRDKFIDVAKKQHPYTGQSEIRCEALIRKSTFIEKHYDEQYQNPRNLASGILNDINIADERKSDINFICVNNGIVPFAGCETNQNVLPYKTITIGELPKYYEFFKERRNALDFPTDGLVIYLTDIEEMEAKGKYPLHSMAIKFPPMEAVTTIQRIEWNLRKSGKWIPKAILEPVDLDGSTIRRTLVFNIGYIRKNGAYPGARVVIAKNGDIIPYIQRIVERGDESRFVLPENSIEDGIHLYSHEGAEAFLARERFITGCQIMGFKNFGYAWFLGLSKLCENDITNLFDTAIVNESSIREIFSGDKRPSQFMQQLNTIKTRVTVFRILRWIQIPNLGPATAKQIARHYSGLKMETSGLEKKLVDDCISGAYADYIKSSIEKVTRLVGEIEYEKEEIAFEGITFEMTGSPKPMFNTKSEFETVVSTWKHTKLEKNTTYLITDDLSSTSSKMAKAKKNGTKILTYEAAVQLHNTL